MEVTVTSPGTGENGEDEVDTVIVEVPVQRDTNFADNTDPSFDSTEGDPGTTVPVDNSGDKIPGGSAIEPGEGAPDGYVPSIDEDGNVKITIPEDATPGDRVEVPVVIEYPDGSKDVETITVVVTQPTDTEGQPDAETPAEVDPETSEANDTQKPTAVEKAIEAEEEATQIDDERLPDTATSTRSLGLLGLSSIVGGLFVGKKKNEDDEN